MNDSDKNKGSFFIDNKIAYLLTMMYFSVQCYFFGYPKCEICSFLGHECYFASRIKEICDCMNIKELHFLFLIYAGGKKYIMKITEALTFKLCRKDGFNGCPQEFIFGKYSEIEDNNIVDVKCGADKGRCSETYQKIFRHLSDRLEFVFGNLSVSMICVICIFLNLQKHETEGTETIHDVLESSEISDNDDNLIIEIGELLTKYKEKLYKSAEIFFNNKNNGLTNSEETDTYCIISFIDDMIISFISEKSDYETMHGLYSSSYDI